MGWNETRHAATLETELGTPAERSRWLANRSPRHPVIVAETNGEIVGRGSLNVFNPREAYRFVVQRGGMALYEKLGFRTVGVHREQGLLDGKWVDTVIMEKLLDQ